MRGKHGRGESSESHRAPRAGVRIRQLRQRKGAVVRRPDQVLVRPSSRNASPKSALWTKSSFPAVTAGGEHAKIGRRHRWSHHGGAVRNIRTSNFRPRPPGSNFVTKVRKVRHFGRGDPFRVVRAPRSPHRGGIARWRHRGGMRGRKRPRQGRAAGASPCLPARPLCGAISGGETPACPRTAQSHDFY
jgi:hypothetical protein